MDGFGSADTCQVTISLFIVEEIAKEKGVQFKAIHLQSKEQAQNAPTPITTYALFYNGEYLTNEQMNDKRFLKLLEK